MTLSETQASRNPIDHVGVASTSSGLPPITQIAFSACRAHYPGGPVWYGSIPNGAIPRRGFPNRAGLPGTNGRSASTTFLSRPARALRVLRPADLLAHLKWTSSRGSRPGSYPPKRLVSYPGISTTPGVGLSPTGNLRPLGRTFVSQNPTHPPVPQPQKRHQPVTPFAFIRVRLRPSAFPPC